MQLTVETSQSKPQTTAATLQDSAELQAEVSRGDEYLSLVNVAQRRPINVLLIGLSLELRPTLVLFPIHNHPPAPPPETDEAAVRVGSVVIA